MQDFYRLWIMLWMVVGFEKPSTRQLWIESLWRLKMAGLWVWGEGGGGSGGKTKGAVD